MGKKSPTKVPKNQEFYVVQTAKLCKWKVDIENLRINIPIGEDPCPASEHLASKFGFSIQYVFDDEEYELNKDLYEPELATKGNTRDKRIKLPPAPQWKRGEKFKTNDNLELQIFEVNKKNKDTTILTMCVIGTMAPNYPINKFTVESNLKSGVWKFIPPKDE